MAPFLYRNALLFCLALTSACAKTGETKQKAPELPVTETGEPKQKAAELPVKETGEPEQKVPELPVKLGKIPDLRLTPRPPVSAAQA